MKEYKINILKKIFISFLTLLLVFTSVTTYQFQYNKNIEVNATEGTLRDKAMQLLAIILATVGVSITSDIDLPKMEDLYNQLSPNAKQAIDNFDYENKYTMGYYGLHVAEYAEIAHSLIDILKLWTLGVGTALFADSNGISTSMPYDLSNIVKYTYTYSYIKYYSIGTFEVNTPQDFISDNPIYYPVYNTIPLTNAKYGNFSFSVVPYSKLTYKGNGVDRITQTSILPTDLVISMKIVTDGLINGHSKDENNAYYFPLFIGTGNNAVWGEFKLKSLVPDYIFTGLSLLYADTLSLPAPSTGWDDSEAGDIDVPSAWQKALDFAGLPLIVLGGQYAQTLDDLKNKGLNDVLVDDVPNEVATEFSKEITNTNPPDPNPNPNPNDTDMITRWIAFIAGTTSVLQHLFDGTTSITDILGDISTSLETITQPVVDAITKLTTDLIDGLTFALQTMLEVTLAPILQTIVQPLLVGLKSLFTWDLDSTKLKFDELKGLMLLRIPCVNETINAWLNVMSANGHTLTSTFTLFGTTITWNSGQLLAAFSGFASLIQNAFKFVFWFIFLKGMRRRITAFLSAMSVDMNIGGKI